MKTIYCLLVSVIFCLINFSSISYASLDQDLNPGQKLINYIVIKDNYDLVIENIYSTVNGCARFTSTALKLSGAYPELPMKQVTIEVADALKERGWIYSENINELAPGDVVFGADENGNGIPDHVFIFYSWENDLRTHYIVIDNQGYKIRRNVYEGVEPLKGAFNFAYLSPDFN